MLKKTQKNSFQKIFDCDKARKNQIVFLISSIYVYLTTRSNLQYMTQGFKERYELHFEIKRLLLYIESNTKSEITVLKTS